MGKPIIRGTRIPISVLHHVLDCLTIPLWPGICPCRQKKFHLEGIGCTSSSVSCAA
ncbi:MAG: hypothetical protein HZA14_02360 [Nitrospirae bacterium]|nr:hypothetical protein [Nitrospirota bacterium]